MIDDTLWWAAMLLVSVLAVAIAYYDGVITSMVTWAIGFLLLMVFRPE